MAFEADFEALFADPNPPLPEAEPPPFLLGDTVKILTGPLVVKLGVITSQVAAGWVVSRDAEPPYQVVEPTANLRRIIFIRSPDNRYRVLVGVLKGRIGNVQFEIQGRPLRIRLFFPDTSESNTYELDEIEPALAPPPPPLPPPPPEAPLPIQPPLLPFPEPPEPILIGFPPAQPIIVMSHPALADPGREVLVIVATIENTEGLIRSIRFFKVFPAEPLMSLVVSFKSSREHQSFPFRFTMDPQITQIKAHLRDEKNIVIGSAVGFIIPRGARLKAVAPIEGGNIISPIARNAKIYLEALWLLVQESVKRVSDAGNNFGAALAELPKLIVGAFLQIFDAIPGVATKSVETVRVEAAMQSLNPDHYTTPEGQAAARHLKESLAHSPQNVPELVETVLIAPMQQLINGILTAATGREELIQDAIVQRYTHVLAIMADFTIIIGVIDTVATAVSGTLVRKIGDHWATLTALAGFGAVAGALGHSLFEASLLKPLQYRVNQEFRPNLPGISDMIRFVVREAIPPTEGGLVLYGKPLPKVLEVEQQIQEFKALMAKLGISEQWADAYWNAHWIIPTRTEAINGFHRGLINEPTLDSLLALNDLDPRWLSLFKGLTYRTLSRVEARYIYETVGLNDAGWDSILAMEGYHPDDIGAVRESMKFFRLRAFLSRERLAASTLFRQGLIKPKIFRDLLARTGLIPKEIETFERAETLRKQSRRIGLRLRILTKLLLTKVIDETRFREELDQLGIPKEEIGDRIDLVKAGLVSPVAELDPEDREAMLLLIEEVIAGEEEVPEL